MGVVEKSIPALNAKQIRTMIAMAVAFPNGESPNAFVFWSTLDVVNMTFLVDNGTNNAIRYVLGRGHGCLKKDFTDELIL